MFREWGISMESADNYEIKNQFTRDTPKVKYSEVVATNGNITLNIKRISGLNEKESKEYTNDITLQLESLFEVAPAAYPGVLTQQVVCPSEFKPIINHTEKESTDITLFTLYANSQFTYGVCSPDLISYKSLFAIILCKNTNNVFEIKLFVPVESFDNKLYYTMNSFSC